MPTQTPDRSVQRDFLRIACFFNRPEGLRIAYVGDGNNVAHSLLEAGALTGTSVSIATPPDYRPDEEIVADAAEVAMKEGGSVLVTTDPEEAVAGVHAVYADAWVSIGEGSEREEVSATVIDGPGPVVFQQAANRLPTELAVLSTLIAGGSP
ncbi:MAG: hypothetical protein JJE35_01025 [Thermoleophilia bacterium]|nr:hypothetical protein [Thermoleophilia bacterium]